MIKKLATLALLVACFTTQAQISIPSKVTIDGKAFQVICEGSTTNATVTALLQDSSGIQGRALFLQGKETLQGTLSLTATDSSYRLTITRSSTNIILLPKPPVEAPPVAPPIIKGNQLSLIDAKAGDLFLATADSPVNVDVMVLYTPAALAAIGSSNAMYDVIQMAMAEANQAYIDSGVFIRLNLVYSGQINYTETSSMSTDLSRLATAGDGYMDDALTLQEQYKADQVCVFISSSDLYAGLAYQLTGNTPTAAYSLVQAIYANGYYTFPHELSHNYGCAHDRDNGVGAATPYGYGNRFYASGTQYRTVMAYAPGIRIGLFSSPLKTFLGATVGTATEDNARTLNERAALIASIKAAPSYTLTLNKNGTGNILVNGTNAPTTLNILRGQTINVSVQGNFLGWSGLQNDNSTNLVVSINQNSTLTAHFVDGTQPLSPRITLNPTSQSLQYGQTLQLTTDAYGIPTPNFQWQFNGVNISGATSKMLIINNVTTAQRGLYQCVISSTSGTATSTTATIQVGEAPSFVQQPVSQLAQIGGNVQFSVLMDCTVSQYQWFFNNAPIPFATNRALSIIGVRTEDAGFYKVQIQAGSYTVTSDDAELVLVSPPTFTQNPVRTEVTRGQTASLSVQASGIQPITYQWRLNGTAISGATNPTLTIPNAQPANAGSYSCQAVNPHGITISSSATLVVYDPLVITKQPVNLTANVGTTPIFSVTASGAAPITYQWFKEGAILLTNQVYSTCRFTNVQLSQAGIYYVEISNPAGTVTSEQVVLTVLYPPAITQQPQVTAVDEGEDATFSVTAVGRQPLSYQWMRNGINLAGETRASLALLHVGATDAGNYSVRITNMDGAITSASASLQVFTAPTITVQPSDATTARGGYAGFAVTASGGSPLSYTWTHNGNAVGANQPTLGFSNVQTNQAGGYRVRVSNRLGYVDSRVAQLIVSDPPKFVNFPSIIYGDEGTNYVFAPLCEGKAPMSYVWRKGTQIITNQTGAALTFEPLFEADGGNYSVTASNEFGAVTSPQAQLAVQTAPKYLLQPSSTTNAEGTTINLSANAKGTSPIVYRWYHAGAFVGNGNYLQITNADIADEGNYWVVASNRLGQTTSSVAKVTISYPPTITYLTPNTTVAEGNNVTLRVTATGRTPMSYKWFKNATAITGATNATLTFTSPTTGDSGVYSVQVVNADGVANSSTFTLTVATLPSFITQPSSRTNNVGQTASFSASATSATALSYQWRKNGVNIANATTASLSFAVTNKNQAGNYQLVASNIAGVVNSSIAILTVLDPPKFVVQPTSQTFLRGQAVSLVAQASSSVTPISYTWKRGTTNVGTGATFTIASPTPSNAGSYSVVASNLDGYATSASATLTLQKEPPVFTTALPPQVTAAPGDSLSLTVAATGVSPITATWYSNNTIIVGQTGLSLTLNNIQTNAATTYKVTLSNEDGTASSSTTLRVLALPPVFTLQPKDVFITRGGTTNFTVACENPAEVTFQWMRNRAAILNATNATLSLTNVQDTNVATYSVIAYNAYGQTESSNASLKIIEVPVITQHPQDTLAAQNSSVVLQFTVQGFGVIRYQWYHDGEPVGNGGLSYTISSLQPASSGNYWAKVWNEAGTNVSRVAQVTMLQPPAISQQPASVACKPGSTATFIVAATGRGSLTYQWYGPLGLLPGATASTLVLDNAQPTQNGNYYVKVSNPDGQLNSSVATLNVHDAPTITLQPSNAAVAKNQAVTLSVRASSASPINYQWYFTNVAVSGGTSSNLTIASASSINEGNYYVILANQVGAVTSRVASLRVAQPPVITQQPVGGTVAIGGSTLLAVTVTGRQPLSYQWYKLGQPIADATQPSLVISPVMSESYASYQVIITNIDGAITSSSAALTAPTGQGTPPGILINPTNTIGVKGRTATLSAWAAGSTPLTYYWTKDGVIAGEGTNLVINPVLESSVGTYQVVVSNAYGTATSLTASLSLAYPPDILSQSPNTSVLIGTPFSIEVTPTNATWCQWLRNGTLFSNGSYTLNVDNAAPTNTGSFVAVLTNVWGSHTSAPIVVTLLTPPTISQQPTGGTFNPGETGTLGVTAIGSPTLKYQWRKEGVAITGATNSMLTLSSIQPAQEGYYTVVVTNAYGAVTSSVTAVTVRQIPVITTQLTNKTINQGQTLTLTIAVTGRSPFTYVWKKDSMTLPSATTATLSIPNVQATDAGNYSVTIANADGSAISTTATVSVNILPYAKTQTLTLTPTKGATCTLSANAGGTSPFTYQWKKNGSSLSGATASTYVMTNIQTTSDGTYSVTVGNVAGTATYSVAIVTVKDAPSITQQPATQIVSPGANVTFSVVASGRTPMSYQWRKNNIDIQGATSASYTLLGVTTNNEGNYSVIVQNSDGLAGSSQATLVVAKPPTITLSPANKQVVYGGSVSFSCGVSGTSPFTYQWYKNGSPIAGATNATYNIPSVHLADEGTYVMTVANAQGSASSTPCTLSILYPPTITSQPVNKTVGQGGTLILEVSAEGRAPMTYLWMFNSRIISGVNSRVLTIQNIQPDQAGTYSVTVTNSDGKAYSQGATITVKPLPVITTNPIPTIVTISNRLELWVSATSATPMTYQWFKDGAMIPGAIGSNYVVTAASYSDAGVYFARVANTIGSVDSEPAIALVLPVQPVKIPADQIRPQMLFYSKQADGAMFLLYHGAVGKSYTIETTADFQTWEEIQTKTATHNLNQCIDEKAIGKPQRFYRIRFNP